MPLTPEERAERKRECNRRYREQNREKLRKDAQAYGRAVGNKKKRKRDPEKAAEYSRQYYLRNRERRIQLFRQRRKEGATRHYEQRYRDAHKKEIKQRRADRLAALAGRPRPVACEVCGRGGKTHFDHCHHDGQFRGWLCGGCNAALGFTNDDPNILRMLADYLERD